MRISGATVLISGATGGLGHALADAFGRRGARLVLTARRAGPLRELAARSGARAVVADLADPADVERLAAESGDVDLLVANAALPGSGDLLDHSVEQLDRALRVNLRAPLVLSRLLLPAMLDAGRGHLAFIGSLSGKAAMSAAPLYGTTKFGLRGFALSLRQDLHGTGVGVSLIQPGLIGDSGMIVRTGASLPRGMRTVTAGQVAAATVRAVERDTCETDVASVEMRLATALAGQFPALAERFQRLLNTNPVTQHVIAAQRDLR
ncbi:SDR family NAD(P)-dependent oxidoreductase [Streptomyces sp. NPDC091281]|uniref:SDR family NAD(P)-dependent oxidoreductase n=1 Tax=Streptomyces sp. NPDC091281 TaxID=3365985 RepID=UPI003815D2AB